MQNKTNEAKEDKTVNWANHRSALKIYVAMLRACKFWSRTGREFAEQALKNNGMGISWNADLLDDALYEVLKHARFFGFQASAFEEMALKYIQQYKKITLSGGSPDPFQLLLNFLDTFVKESTDARKQNIDTAKQAEVDAKLKPTLEEFGFALYKYLLFQEKALLTTQPGSKAKYLLLKTKDVDSNSEKGRLRHIVLCKKEDIDRKEASKLTEACCKANEEYKTKEEKRKNNIVLIYAFTFCVSLLEAVVAMFFAAKLEYPNLLGDLLNIVLFWHTGPLPSYALMLAGGLGCLVCNLVLFLGAMRFLTIDFETLKKSILSIFSLSKRSAKKNEQPITNYVRYTRFLSIVIAIIGGAGLGLLAAHSMGEVLGKLGLTSNLLAQVGWASGVRFIVPAVLLGISVMLALALLYRRKTSGNLEWSVLLGITVIFSIVAVLAFFSPAAAPMLLAGCLSVITGFVYVALLYFSWTGMFTWLADWEFLKNEETRWKSVKAHVKKYWHIRLVQVTLLAVFSWTGLIPFYYAFYHIIIPVGKSASPALVGLTAAFAALSALSFAGFVVKGLVKIGGVIAKSLSPKKIFKHLWPLLRFLIGAGFATTFIIFNHKHILSLAFNKMSVSLISLGLFLSPFLLFALCNACKAKKEGKSLWKSLYNFFGQHGKRHWENLKRRGMRIATFVGTIFGGAAQSGSAAGQALTIPHTPKGIIKEAPAINSFSGNSQAIPGELPGSISKIVDQNSNQCVLDTLSNNNSLLQMYEKPSSNYTSILNNTKSELNDNNTDKHNQSGSIFNNETYASGKVAPLLAKFEEPKKNNDDGQSGSSENPQLV